MERPPLAGPRHDADETPALHSPPARPFLPIRLLGWRSARLGANSGYTMVSPAIFVGREAERRRVARLWSRSRIVVFVGVSGIGKTALMRRVLEDAAGQAPVWTARC